eukprot:jgi/Ulvmu1/12577/UM092_0007.1
MCSPCAAYVPLCVILTCQQLHMHGGFEANAVQDTRDLFKRCGTLPSHKRVRCARTHRSAARSFREHRLVAMLRVLRMLRVLHVLRASRLARFVRRHAHHEICSQPTAFLSTCDFDACANRSAPHVRGATTPHVCGARSPAVSCTQFPDREDSSLSALAPVDMVAPFHVTSPLVG